MALTSENKARKLGAWSAKPEHRDLWALSKRELIEIALSLAAQGLDSYETALASGQAADRVRDERRHLRAARLI